MRSVTEISVGQRNNLRKVGHLVIQELHRLRSYHNGWQKLRFGGADKRNIRLIFLVDGGGEGDSEESTREEEIHIRDCQRRRKPLGKGGSVSFLILLLDVYSALLCKLTP
jgi:hypothetical protein